MHLLTHSDEGKPAGRNFIADRRPDQRRLLGTFDLPVVSATEPYYFHAGGCQLLGDCLVVPCETGQNKSVVMFFDVSDHMQIREFDVGLRIPRNDRDAAAAGLTDFVREGHDVWLLAVFDSGTVDFYESLDLTDTVPFFSKFSCKVPEKHHEALVLLTDASNRVFAVGLNKTFFGEDTAVLYEVDLANEKLNPVTEVSYTTRNGASLRWAASLEIVSDTNLRLHCTASTITTAVTSIRSTPHRPCGGARPKGARQIVARGSREVVAAGGSMSPRQVARTREGLSMVKKKRTRRTAALSAPRDLSAGVIVVLSGGPFDLTNPPEVRDRMDQYIADLNADPYVQANTGGNGLTFKLLQNQQFPHLHQTKWRQVCAALNLLAATPLILVGHSNGGAAAVDLARCLQSQGEDSRPALHGRLGADARRHRRRQ